MTTQNRTPESSVTGDIIRKVHLTLADGNAGKEILNFLKSTEPEFMNEVNRFIQTEVSRMRYTLSETQALYVGSVIGASYIAGFLIAREAAHKLFNGAFTFKSDIASALTPEQINNIIDKNLKQGKSYKEIAKVIKTMLERNKKITRPNRKSKNDKCDRGNHLNIGDLE